MKNLSKDAIPHDPEGDRQLYDVLEKVGTEQPEDDENTSVEGENPQPDEGVEGRRPGTIATSWGEESPEGMQFSQQMYAKFREGRETLLNKLFNNKSKSDKAARVKDFALYAWLSDRPPSKPALPKL